MTSAGLLGRYIVRGATGWFLLVVAGQGGRKMESSHLSHLGLCLICPLISLQLISCLPPAQQSTINHCWRKLMSAGLSAQEKSWLLGWALLAWGQGCKGSSGRFLGLLGRGPGALCHLGKL